MDDQERCNSQVASIVPAARKGYRVWTSAEVRYLKQHRTDGAELIAEALGRSVSSVQAKACAMGVSLMYKPGDMCPFCGRHRLRDGTLAAKHGMCIACWERRKTDVMEEQASELRERKRYDAAKKAKRVQVRK